MYIILHILEEQNLERTNTFLDIYIVRILQSTWAEARAM